MEVADRILALEHRSQSLETLAKQIANGVLQMQAEGRADRAAMIRLADAVQREAQDVAEIRAQLVTMLPATLNAAQRAADNTGSFKLMPKDGDSGKHAAVSLFREFRKAPRSTQILTTVIAVVAAVALIFHAVR